MTQHEDHVTAAEEQGLSAFMQRLQASAPDRAPRMPSAEVLVLKAQLIRKWEAQRRIMRPIELMEPFEVATAVAAAVLLLAWSVPSAFDWVPRLMF
jgi:hypothetical protein